MHLSGHFHTFTSIFLFILAVWLRSVTQMYHSDPLQCKPHITHRYKFNCRVNLIFVSPLTYSSNFHFTVSQKSNFFKFIKHKQIEHDRLSAQKCHMDRFKLKSKRRGSWRASGYLNRLEALEGLDYNADINNNWGSGSIRDNINISVTKSADLKPNKWRESKRQN
jgi:hypothetical protein